MSKSAEDFKNAKETVQLLLDGWMKHGNYQLTFEEYVKEDDKFFKGHKNIYGNNNMFSNNKNVINRWSRVSVSSLFFFLSYTKRGPRGSSFGDKLEVAKVNLDILNEKIEGFQNATLAEFISYFFFAGLLHMDADGKEEEVIYNPEFPKIEDFISNFRIHDNFDEEGFNSFIKSNGISELERKGFFTKHPDSLFALAYMISGYNSHLLEEFKNTFIDSLDPACMLDQSLNLLYLFKKYCEGEEEIPFALYANIHSDT